MKKYLKIIFGACVSLLGIWGGAYFIHLAILYEVEWPVFPIIVTGMAMFAGGAALAINEFA